MAKFIYIAMAELRPMVIDLSFETVRPMVMDFYFGTVKTMAKLRSMAMIKTQQEPMAIAGYLVFISLWVS